ncbi:remorin 1.4 isoform X1 [Jatropha curcas]|uniref:remorin 1.4 isoform X1 n=1 Tax=Jatropha curcas TaxID=180498 RepID=UPI0005FBB1B0|nr:remorin 1.4 isoform X1 [Jatropha curcas]
MDYLIKQTSRVRLARPQQSTEGPSSSRERRISFQKTPSFKEEKKRSQNWFRRQISWQMNQDYDSIGLEQATAVAAAAYAVSTMKESSKIPEKKKISSEGREPSFARTKSRKEPAPTVPSPELKKIKEIPEPSFSRIKSRKEGTTTSVPIELGEDSVRHPEIPAVKTQEKVVDAPQIKKGRTFAEEQSSRTDEIQPESVEPKPDKPAIRPEVAMPKPDLSATIKPETSPAKFDGPTSRRPGIGGGGTEADIWERDELARIKKKYEELNARILSWENKKKAKSRRKLDKIESELERKRIKAFEQFHSEVDDINQIAGGARVKAKERQRKEELKAKEKANQIRKTGKAPNSRSCF